MMRSKTIVVAGHVIRVYSNDGRTWCNRPIDLARFERRYGRERAELRRVFARIDTAEQYEIIY